MSDQVIQKDPRKFTGWHMLAICICAFGVIITVNVILAVNAIRSFPGLNVPNSYVASQEFNDRRAAQEALGWTIAAAADADSLRIAITDAVGAPVAVDRMKVILGRTTHQQADIQPDLSFDGQAYVSHGLDLGRGRWALRLNAWAQDGTHFEQRLVLIVKG